MIRLALLASLVLTSVSFADGAQQTSLISTLVTPAAASAPATTINVDLLRVNPAATDAAFTAPDLLRGQLSAAGRRWPVELQARASAPADVSAGAFASRSYTLVLPPDALGNLVLEVEQEAIDDTPAMTLRAVVYVAAGATPDMDSRGEVAQSPITAVTPVVAQLQNTFVGRFSAHEPIYFIYGPDDPAAKFQFSFKYRVLNFGSIRGEKAALKFGYTQRSLWELGSSSSPFYDTSYIPSLFAEWLAPPGESSSSDPLQLLGVQGGFQHESNGQADTQSRSLNILFARASFLLGPPDGLHVVATPRVFTYVGGLSDNRELARYRGNADLQLTFGRTRGTALVYTGRVGTGFEHFTSQVDVTIPIRTRWLDFASYLLFQYFDGYGENLRDYDEKIRTIRAGFSLLR